MSTLASTSGWVVAGTLAAVGALAVALLALLVNVIKGSDEGLTPSGVRRYIRRVIDEERTRRAAKVYALVYYSDLHERLTRGKPRPGDKTRMGLLLVRERRIMQKVDDSWEEILRQVEERCKRWAKKKRRKAARRKRREPRGE